MSVLLITGIDYQETYQMFCVPVDWALLAQQWIRMKEVKEHVVMNVAGPSIGQCHIPVEPVSALAPRALTGFCFNASNTVGGEAPMDVEKEENEGNSDAQSST